MISDIFFYHQIYYQGSKYKNIGIIIFFSNLQVKKYEKKKNDEIGWRTTRLYICECVLYRKIMRRRTILLHLTVLLLWRCCCRHHHRRRLFFIISMYVSVYVPFFLIALLLNCVRQETSYRRREENINRLSYGIFRVWTVLI